MRAVEAATSVASTWVVPHFSSESSTEKTKFRITKKAAIRFRLPQTLSAVFRQAYRDSPSEEIAATVAAARPRAAAVEMMKAEAEAAAAAEAEKEPRKESAASQSLWLGRVRPPTAVRRAQPQALVAAKEPTEEPALTEPPHQAAQPQSQTVAP